MDNPAVSAALAVIEKQLRESPPAGVTDEEITRYLRAHRALLDRQLRAEVASTLPPFRVLSYGGGLDSFAMLLVMLERDDEPIDLVIFADVGDPQGLDPAEWPGTYRHVREHVMPLCQQHGVPFVWLGTDLIPIRSSKNHPEGFRSLFAYYEGTQMMFGRTSRVCTVAAKVDRIRRYVQAARPPGRRVEMLIGFEAGEEARAENDPHAAGKGDPTWVARFPLVEQGLCRCRCEALVRKRGLPVPRKSACVFCPYSSRGDFQRLRAELPQAFARVQVLEDNAKPTKKGARMRFGFKDGRTDPRLSEWIAPTKLTAMGKQPRAYKRRDIACQVCGAAVRASKEVGCGLLDEPLRPALPAPAARRLLPAPEVQEAQLV